MVIIIVLVVAVGVIGSFFLTGTFNNDTSLNLTNNTSSLDDTSVINQTDLVANNSTANQTTDLPQQEYISRSRAIEIAKQSAAIYPGDEVKFTAVLHETYDPPYWQVVAWNNDPSSPSYNHAVGGAYINAITGEVISAHG